MMSSSSPLMDSPGDSLLAVACSQSCHCVPAPCARLTLTLTPTPTPAQPLS